MPDADAPSAEAAPGLRCPNCGQPMQAQELQQNYQGTVRADLCFACAGIWFGRQSSSRLAPGAVIELFKQIHPHLEGDRQPLAAHPRCPDCGDALELGYDLCKTGRFTYFRCPRGDGRYTQFFQFLREKQFVRDLTPAEIAQVKAQVQQIRCSGCGAPVDLEKSSVCSFCHAPVSFLDATAVEKALQMWSAASARSRAAVDPAAVAEALLMRPDPPPPPRAPSAFARLDGDTLENVELGVDLVVAGIRALGHLLG